MELVLKPSDKLRVVFEEKEYLLSKPTMGLAREMEAMAKSAQADGMGSEVVYKYIVGAGMPEDVVSRLEPEMATAIIEALQPKKKN